MFNCAFMLLINLVYWGFCGVVISDFSGYRACFLAMIESKKIAQDAKHLIDSVLFFGCYVFCLYSWLLLVWVYECFVLRVARIFDFVWVCVFSVIAFPFLSFSYFLRDLADALSWLYRGYYCLILLCYNRILVYIFP